MSSRITMALVMNLLLLLFSFVPSGQSIVPLRSFKISGNITYDCIDIHKQPGLDHPLLKNHTIQMKPTVSKPDDLKSRIGKNNKSYTDKIKCPHGTVPILRNSKEYNTNTQYLHPMTIDSPGTHIAGVRSQSGPFHGVQALFNGYKLNIKKDQASYSQIYIGSGLNKEINFISTGLMINPSNFPDGRVWSFAYFKGKNGEGCYNTACLGFIQVSREEPITKPIDLSPGKSDWTHCFIHQDRNTENWWLTKLMPDAPPLYVGYWPKELFNLLDNGANMVGVGGVVYALPPSSSPPMGNGNFPNNDQKHSTMFTNIEVLNDNHELLKMNSFPVEILLDSPKCYGLRIGKGSPSHNTSLGYFFNYGGPGGNSCGI